MVKFQLIEDDSDDYHDDDTSNPNARGNDDRGQQTRKRADDRRRLGAMTARERERDAKIATALSKLPRIHVEAEQGEEENLSPELPCSSCSEHEVVDSVNVPIASTSGYPTTTSDADRFLDELSQRKRPANLRALPSTDQNHLRRRTRNINRFQQANALLEVPLDQGGAPLIGSTRPIETNVNRPNYQPSSQKHQGNHHKRPPRQEGGSAAGGGDKRPRTHSADEQQQQRRRQQNRPR